MLNEAGLGHLFESVILAFGGFNVYTVKSHADSDPYSVTLSDKIFHALAEDILAGVIAPGERLDEPSICRKFKVSRTPAREALRRLDGTGLVEITPRRGVTVARVDAEQLHDMFEALAELEGLCARLGAVRMTTLQRRQLQVFNDKSQASVKNKHRDLVALNNEFHELVYEGSQNASIAAATRNFRQRLAPFRALQFKPGATEYSFHEHDQIVDAIVRSDPERAYIIMRDHVIGTGLQVIEHFSEIDQGAERKRAVGGRHSVQHHYRSR